MDNLDAVPIPLATQMEEYTRKHEMNAQLKVCNILFGTKSILYISVIRNCLFY